MRELIWQRYFDPPLGVWTSGKIQYLISKFGNGEKCLGRLIKVCYSDGDISRTIWCKSVSLQVPRDFVGLDPVLNQLDQNTGDPLVVHPPVLLSPYRQGV